jgi:hypothetical protein
MLVASGASLSYTGTGTITATSAQTAVSATNFSGALVGDVTGSQNATVVGKIQGTAVSSTAPATSGQIMTYNGSQWAPSAAAFVPVVASNTTANCTTASTSYTSTLSTGCSSVAVTVTTGTRVMVIVTSRMTAAGSSFSGTVQGFTAFAVSGATTVGASDAQSLELGLVGSSNGSNDTHEMQASATYVLTTLTAGSNTFTLNYKSPGGDTITYTNRTITVIPLP